MAIRHYFMTALLCFSGYSYAAPFTIVPSTTLPTEILPGGTTKAFYTVTNNTCSVQSGIKVKSFLPQVTQVTVDPSIPDLCTSVSILEPCNTPDSSCTLELQISEPVHADKDDLAVCLSDGSTCACTDYLLNVNEVALVTVGESFSDNFDAYLPLTYTSGDGGNNWPLSPTPSLPAGKDQGLLYVVDCNGSNCSTVGYAFNNSTDKIPLAYTSTDGGKNWSKPATFSSVPNAQGTVFSVSCVSSHCTAVGESSDAGVTTLMPLAYTSTNGGNTWNLFSTLPPPASGGLLTSVTCSNSHCIAVGASGNPYLLSQFPIAYTSSDGGNNWIQSSAFNLPGTATAGVLYNITCTNLNCITVGNYYDPITGYSVGLAYTSNNGGNTWSSPITFPSPGGGQTQLFLGGASCMGAICTAVGQSVNSGFTILLPAAYTSTNGGATWTISTTNPLPLPGSQPQGGLSGLTCIGDTCIAVGESSNNSGSNNLPLNYISYDAGMTWRLSNSSNIGFTLPSGQKQGILSGISDSW